MGNCLLFVGTYTSLGGEGIYAIRCSADGDLVPIGLSASAEDSSFLAVNSGNYRLYAVGEVKRWMGERGGFVGAYSIDRESGTLELLDQVSSGGVGPCHICVDRRGRFAFVSNYVDGSLAVFKLLENGCFGPVTAHIQHPDTDLARPPRVHGVFLSPEEDFAVVPDKGLNKLFVYRFEQNSGCLSPAGSVDLPQGAGPRHVAFHPTGRYGYVLNELNSTIASFAFCPTTGELALVHQVSTLPPRHLGQSIAAEIAVDPEGKFLYASNRGADTIAAFRIADAASPELIEQVSSEGNCPRHFAIDPSGAWMVVANQDSNSISVFSRDRLTGQIVFKGQVPVNAPACMVFV